MIKVLLISITLLGFSACVTKPSKLPIIMPSLKPLPFDGNFNLHYLDKNGSIYTIDKKDLDKCILKAKECKYKLQFLNQQIKDFNAIRQQIN